MDEKSQELRREHKRRRPLIRERSVQRGLRVVSIATSTPNEVQVLDVFPPTLSHEARVVSARGLSARLDGQDREPSARLDDLLPDIGAFARHEMLTRAICRDR